MTKCAYGLLRMDDGWITDVAMGFELELDAGRWTVASSLRIL